MLNRWIFGVSMAVCLFFSCAYTFAKTRAQQGNPFCSDAGCTETRALLKQMCDYIVAEKAGVPTIYVGGYYMRTLVDGYEILGDHRYLDTALAYSDYLIGKQMSNGFWPTGYGSGFPRGYGQRAGALHCAIQARGPGAAEEIPRSRPALCEFDREERHDSPQWRFRDRLGACRRRHDDEAYSRTSTRCPQP